MHSAKSTKTQRRKLFPSIFPNCPSYLSSAPPAARTTASTSAARFEAAEVQHDEAVEEFFNEDIVSSLENLESINHSFYNKINQNSMLIFVSVAIIDNVPRISASVSVNSSLIASVAINGILLTPQDVNKFTNNCKISFVSQFFKLLNYCESLVNNNDNATDWKGSLLASLESKLDHMEDTSHLSFISEQLSLFDIPCYLMNCPLSGTKYLKHGKFKEDIETDKQLIFIFFLFKIMYLYNNSLLLKFIYLK